ncbi:chemotaxis protein CheC [Geomonas sp.]|uniref:chemotaxis protein CheC n=1 Tax=Geomonas sp. TaxID=2651584 RepID=UPI002B4646EB|nr:chemotaxis protein CheC [Geomonas sp.]HJV34312.1 chemotaxis protein CheC [Geomonas sp.]
MHETSALMTPLEKDALQEIMNISFGQAAAGLSEVINLYVTLSVPYIDVLAHDEVLRYIQAKVPDAKEMSMVMQLFSGNFSGSSVLLFPHGEGKKLLQMFSQGAGSALGGHDLDVLERESLIEISNIIIGACISRIAEMLGDVVSYYPPRFYAKEQIDRTLSDSFATEDSFAIFFKTLFQFEEYDARGYLFLVSNGTTLEWLKKAIWDYLRKYAGA